MRTGLVAVIVVLLAALTQAAPASAVSGPSLSGSAAQVQYGPGTPVAPSCRSVRQTCPNGPGQEVLDDPPASGGGPGSGEGGTGGAGEDSGSGGVKDRIESGGGLGSGDGLPFTGSNVLLTLAAALMLLAVGVGVRRLARPD